MTRASGNKIISQETIIRGELSSRGELASGVSLQLFASSDCGVKGFCTALATFEPGAELPYHVHAFSEAVTVLEGQASVAVEGRSYLLDRLDCIHIPKSRPHATVNVSAGSALRLLLAFAGSQPTRELVDGSRFVKVHLGSSNAAPKDPEHIQRLANAGQYELASGTKFFDLFAGRMGAEGICGGYGEFGPGTSLPCHVHDFAESITIVTGAAACEVAGRHHSVSGYDTAVIPQGFPHRFLNQTEKTMGMIWIYAGSEPSRTLVETGYCSGVLP